MDEWQKIVKETVVITTMVTIILQTFPPTIVVVMMKIKPIYHLRWMLNGYGY